MSKQGKATNAKLLKTILKILFHNLVILVTSPVILGTSASKNKTIGAVMRRCETFWDILGFLLYVFRHFGTY